MKVGLYAGGQTAFLIMVGAGAAYVVLLVRHQRSRHRTLAAGALVCAVAVAVSLTAWITSMTESRRLCCGLPDAQRVLSASAVLDHWPFALAVAALLGLPPALIFARAVRR